MVKELLSAKAEIQNLKKQLALDVCMPTSRAQAEHMIEVAKKYLLDHMPERHAR